MKWWCIIVWIITSASIRSVISNISKPNAKTEALSICASTIVERYTVTNFLLIHSNVNDLITDMLRYKIPKTTMRFDSKFRITKRYDHFDFYVIVVDSVENLEGILKRIYNKSIYRPLQKSLVIYTGQSRIRQILEVLWYYFSFNVVLLTYNTEMYTYFPYKNGECGDNIEATYLANCNDVFNANVDLYPSKVPLYVNGCALRLLPLEVPPYVLNANDPTDPGLEVTIAREVGKRINFTIKVVRHFFNETGYKYLPGGTFTGLYDLLNSRKGDLIFGMLRQNISYVNDFDSTYIHLFDEATWHVATATGIGEWKNLTMIFTWRLWTLVFICIFICPFSWWFVGRVKPDLKNYVEIERALLTAYHILLGGSTKPPKTSLLRMLFLTWTLSAILLIAAYQSKLVSLLTKTVYGHQISTEEEFISLKLKFGYFPAVQVVFEDYANQTGYNLYKNYKPCPIVGNDCIERAAYKRDFVVLKNRRQIRYLTKRILLFPNGRNRLYSMKKGIFSYLIRMMTHKGFPFLPRINYLLLNMQENGLIDKWDKDIAPTYKHIEKSETKKLQLSHMQGVFMLFILGLSLALTAFLLEICSNSTLGYRKIICFFKRNSK